ncbi:hypothetical protein QTH89_21145 [Variovorax sp. J22G21]|uniref:hypothetical protein n=1 Tax=Variovorax fucosicus TaxID=3053517 RepID=UPI002576BBCA|nr:MULTISPECIES: hypothetical protein [unclassified Variovorax]MDM0038953.1 hypothetical protein [Variovorax sp. J22R193]MDM0063729.1 hypothetical protein [Variovorax sp. J22G21]
MHHLAQHQKNRDLVSISRDEIDTNSIQGFVLASSDELVVLQYVYDFNLDGLMVLRVADISEVQASATDRFQKELLAHEGLEEKVPFASTFDLLNWRALISQLAKQNALVTLECETSDMKELVIGRVQKTAASWVEVQQFTGAANWVDTPIRLDYENISCCQVGTNYVNVYQRHFERTAR